MSTSLNPSPTRDAYLRVSRVGGRNGDSYQSPTDQEEAVRALAARRGYEVAGVVIEEDVSGGRRVNDRKLEALVARVESGESGGILAYDVQRFARSVAEGAAAIKRIKDAGGEFCDSFGNSTRENSLAINIYLAIGEDQLEKLTDRWERSRRRAVEQGKFIGPAPLGYRKAPDKRLVADRHTAPIVRQAFELAADRNLAAARAHLEAHLPAQRWTLYFTKRLIKNRVYLGEVHHGESMVNRHAHEPLVSMATFLAAQPDDGEIRSRSRRLNYPLSGVARCGSCGGKLVGQIGHTRKDGTTPRHYRCSTKWNGARALGQCDQPVSCKADDLEAIVRDEFSPPTEALGPPDVSGSTAELEAELEAAERQRSEWATDLAAQAALGRTAWLEGARARRARVEELQAQLRDERRIIDPWPDPDELGDPEAFRLALDRHVESVTIYRHSADEYIDEHGYHRRELPGRAPLKYRVDLLWRD